MWRRIANPDILVFLDVSYPVTLVRRNWNWLPADYEEQQRRLAHARKHADLLIDTDDHTPEEVVRAIIGFLEK